MKKKMLAALLSLMMIASAFPAGAIGMVSVETAKEIAEFMPEEEKAVLSAESIPENAPEWALFYEDYETKTADEKHPDYGSVTYAQDGYAATYVIYGNSGTYVQDPANSENMVIKTVSKGMYNSGFKIKLPTALSKTGSYSISYKYYIDPLVDENFNNVGFCDRLYFKTTEGDGNFYPLGFDYKNITNTWLTRETTFDITETNGTKYISINGGTATEYTDDIVMLVLHNASSNKGTWSDENSFTFYYDDLTLTYFSGAVDFEYVDEEGNTLYETTVTTAKVALPSKTTLGVDYYPGFYYNGEKITSNEFVIPSGSESMQITVKPDDVIFYDDFESREIQDINTPGQTAKTVPAFVRAGSAVWLQKTDDFTYTDSSTGTVYKSLADWNIVEIEDGKKALNINGWNPVVNNIGFDVRDVDISKPGVYRLSFRLKQELGTNATSVSGTWHQHLPNNNLQTPGIASSVSANNLGKWYDVVFTYNVVDNGDGTVTTSVTNNCNDWTPAGLTHTPGEITRFRYYFNFNPLNISQGKLYFDYMKLTYGAHVTVNYVDADGVSVYTEDSYQGAELKLPTAEKIGRAYTPVYTIGGKLYHANDVYTIPANADSAITVKVDRMPVPATAPDYAILFEDFSGCTAEMSGRTDIPFIFKAEGHDTAKLTYYAGTPSFSAAPDYAGNMTIKIVGNDMYTNGLVIKDISISDVGKYTVSYDFYTPDSVEKHPKLAGFARIFEGDTFYQWGGWNNDNIQRGTWNTVTYNWEIYMDGDKKMLKYNSWDPAVEITEATKIELYNVCQASVADTNDRDGDSDTTELVTSASDDNPYTVYYDNVSVTYEKLAEVTATFVDANGESFDFVQTEESYGGSVKLPSGEEMSLGYTPEFIAPDGNVYYSGMTYTPSEFACEVEFVVAKSNVVYFENYEDLEGGWAAPDVAIAPFADAAAYGDRKFANSTSLASRTNNLAVNSNTPEMIKTTITKPGVYKISVDTELEVVKNADTDKVVDSLYVNIQLVGIDAVVWTSTGADVWLKPTEAEYKKPVYGWFEVYEEDGELYIRKFNHTHDSKILASKIDQIRFGAVVTDDFKNSTEIKAAHYVYYDNVKVEYYPYAATNTGLASFRELDYDGKGGPAGIRFASYITDEQKSIVSEYGYVVTRKESITSDGVVNYDLLNLEGIDEISITTTTSGVNNDGIKVVAAASYDGVKDKIFATDGKYFENENVTFRGSSDIFFTGVLYGIKDEYKDDVYVARPYVKIDGIYHYGECHEASYNDVYNKANA